MKEILNKVALRYIGEEGYKRVSQYSPLAKCSRRSLENRTSLHGSLRVHQLEFTVLDGPRVVQVVQSVVEAEVDAQGKIWAKLSEKEKRSHVQNKLAGLAAAELMASERK